MKRDTEPLRPPMDSQRTERTRGVPRYSNHPGMLGAMPSARRRRVADDAGARATHAAPASNDVGASRCGLTLAATVLVGLLCATSIGYAFGLAAGVTIAALAVIALLAWTMVVRQAVDRGVVALPDPDWVSPSDAIVGSSTQKAEYLAHLLCANQSLLIVPSEVFALCGHAERVLGAPLTLAEFLEAVRIYQGQGTTRRTDVKA